MIPVLDTTDSTSPEISAFLSTIRKAGFSGDIDTTLAGRLVMATDNSIYQRLPAAVVYPRQHDDVVTLCRVASQAGFEKISFSARGGGTGTNGQSLTSGIVVDLSRHMTRVLEVNAEQGWARVEAGMVKDALNDAVREHGLFFAPDTSTSNRATIGGMINTDASGQGSLVYGKTSDHMLSLRAVLASGEELQTEPISWVKARALAEGQGDESRLYRRLLDSVDTHGDEIDARFPDLNRFLTGYDLKHAASRTAVDLGRLICGSEGSLAIVTEAKLNLEPIPKQRVLINISYDSFDAALRHAPVMMEARATSVETVDSRVIDLARGDVIWGSVADLITESPDRAIQGLNMVEFSGQDMAAVRAVSRWLTEHLDQAVAQVEGGIIGYHLADDLDAIQRIYAMRKKSVGLLGRSPGRPMPTAFVEDTCVPPERLADYIAEFRAMLDSHGLEYGMFGHVDAGVLHVRPIMDLCDPSQAAMVKRISDEVVELTARYGGLLWGEHGRGYRAGYAERYFGATLHREMRAIKAAFDPENRMNPGKLFTPLGDDDARLVGVEDEMRADADRTIPATIRDDYAGPADCNGNGLCFNYSASVPMCPSYRASGDRRYSPKGRAALLREWLRRLERAGGDSARSDLNEAAGESLIANLSRADADSMPGDYSHQVMDAMSECLACKACRSSCPMSVDIPRYRARFLKLYHQRYRRPLRDYLLASLESLLPLAQPFSAIYNAVVGNPGVGRIFERRLGVSNLPLLSRPGVDRCARRLEVSTFKSGSVPKEKTVYLLQDPFNRYFEASVFESAMKLLLALGYEPVLLPYRPNGKSQHVAGFLGRFRRTAQRQMALLKEVTQSGAPIIALEPSVGLCLRDEYNEALKLSGDEFHVPMIQEWLVDQLDQIPPRPESGLSFSLMIHCSEKSELPASGADWQRIFQHLGVELTVLPGGCCGMGGVYGHQTEHAERSKAIYDLSWRRPVESSVGPVLATGYSCRSQVRKQSAVNAEHPVQALSRRLSQTAT